FVAPPPLPPRRLLILRTRRQLAAARPRLGVIVVVRKPAPRLRRPVAVVIVGYPSPGFGRPVVIIIVVIRPLAPRAVVLVIIAAAAVDGAEGLVHGRRLRLDPRLRPVLDRLGA